MREDLYYDLAKFAMEQLPYNDFELNGFTDLNSEDNFIPLTNEEWLELLYLNRDIKSTEINKTTNKFIIHFNDNSEINFDIKWDKDFNRYIYGKFVYIDEILYYTQLVYGIK